MSNVDKIIESVIPSTTVKTWIYETEHKFEFNEILSLIWNSNNNLKTKLQILQEFNNEEFLIEYGIRNTNILVARLTSIIDTIQHVIEFAYSSNAGYVVRLSYNSIDDIENSEENNIVVGNMTILKETLKDKDIECAIGDVRVDLIDINNGDVHIEYYLTEDNEPYDFQIVSNLCKFENKWYMVLRKPWELDSYIELPVNFHMGDKVKLCDTEEVYVVCNGNVPCKNDGTNLDITDTSIMVIPEETFDKGKDYKQQLLDEDKEDIKNGISKLYSRHEHLPIMNIERV